MWSAARSAKISMILCMPERVSGGDAKFQGFCDGWNKWEGTARVRRREFLAQDPHKIVLVIVSPGSVNTALGPLRMARKLDRYRETARMTLQPWVVERALDRLGDRRLTLQEQQTVLKATRTPTKVRWPDWWRHSPRLAILDQPPRGRSHPGTNRQGDCRGMPPLSGPVRIVIYGRPLIASGFGD